MSPYSRLRGVDPMEKWNEEELVGNQPVRETQQGDQVLD